VSKQYFENLVEAVGSSFYYYTHMKEINLASNLCLDYEKLMTGWADEYHGEWNLQGGLTPLHYNTFKPAVDQLVRRIIKATEDEIQRRFAEQWNDYMNNLGTQDKNSESTNI